MENKIEKFINFRVFMFKYLMVFLVAGGSLLFLTGLSQLLTSQVPWEGFQIFTIMIGTISLFFIVLFLLCLPVFFIYWLMVRKILPKIAPAEKKKAKLKFFAGLGFAAAAIIFFTIVTTFHLGAVTCNDSECFLDLANSCTAVEWRTTDKAGMEWEFYSSPYCRFEKELLTITGNESGGMKKVLEGQGLTCDYERNQFDSLWVSSLIFDLEPCQGELKESIAKLLLLL